MPTPENHALLSASSAARWLACPPSARLAAQKPDRPTKYTEAGTLAHRLGELKLRKLFGSGTAAPMRPSAYKKQLAAIQADPAYEPEMDRCTDEYVQHIQEIALQYPQRPMIAIEQRVDFSAWVPEGFGTSDCILLTPAELHVCDYKNGKGVPVSAIENPQMKLYALGALARYAPFYPGIETVHLHIIQPLAGGVSVWQTTRAALDTWAEEVVRPAAQLAWEGKGEFRPGEAQCRWCPTRNTCRARAEQTAQIAAAPGFGKLPPELSLEELGEALAVAGQVADWLEKLRVYTTHILEDGGHVPGYKLVEGRTTRAWRNQAAAFDTLRERGLQDALLYERVPVTVAKLEKALNKKCFAQLAADLITKTPGKPTLVPESDPRPAYSPARADFADILNQQKEN